MIIIIIGLGFFAFRAARESANARLSRQEAMRQSLVFRCARLHYSIELTHFAGTSHTIQIVTLGLKTYQGWGLATPAPLHIQPPKSSPRCKKQRREVNGLAPVSSAVGT